LAKRTSSAAHSRSCATPPALDCTAASCTVWIESTTSSLRMLAARAVGEDFLEVGLRRHLQRGRGQAEPLRRAGHLGPDSSPVAYSTDARCATLAATCSSSVDLPMPGSPPSSVTLPGTKPPPSTRSSSPCPEPKRTGRPSVDRASGAVVAGRGARVDVAPERAAGASRRSSVFHSPQPGHWPCHLGESAPQAEQTKTVLGRAIGFLGGRRGETVAVRGRGATPTCWGEP
jgi:hypothetical protein